VNIPIILPAPMPAPCPLCGEEHRCDGDLVYVESLKAMVHRACRDRRQVQAALFEAREP
jgi:hypothetical protein